MLSGREGISHEMIGRHGAQRRLLDLVDAAEIGSADHPEVAFVVGEAGIGKTRLLHEVVLQLPDSVAVWSMSAPPGTTGRLGGALSTLMRRRGTDWEPLGTDRDERTTGPGDEVGAAVAAIVETARRAPTLLVVEDVHGIDALSATMVDRVARSSLPALVIVATYRSGALVPGSPGGELVQLLERRHDAQQLRLDRLDRAEIAAMIAAISERAPDSALVEAVQRRSGGVPFVIEELMRCCGPQSLAGQVLSASLPWSLDEVIRKQIAGLDDERRVLLETLSVLGGPTGFDVLVEVAELDEDTAIHAVRELIAAEILIEIAEDQFWFVHALVAEAVEAQLLGRQRRQIHQRCAAVLGKRAEADPMALARHALGAGRYDELPQIARAGAPRYLEQGASFHALRLAAQGLEECPGDTVLLGVATDAAWRLGFIAEAHRSALAWVEAEQDPIRRADALRMLGRLAVELGDASSAERARRGLEELISPDGGAAPPEVEAAACAARAQVEMLAHRGAEAVAWADRAIAVSDRLGDSMIRARASADRAAALLLVGGPNDAVTEALRRAVDMARETGDQVLLARSINNLLDQLPAHGDEAASLRSELTRAGRAGGMDTVSWGARYWWEAEGARCSGDLAAFRRAIAEARHWWGLVGSVRLAALAEAVLAYEDGRMDAAWTKYSEYLASVTPAQRDADQPFGFVLAVAADDPAAPERFEALVAGSTPGDGPRLIDDVLGVVEAALKLGIDPDEVHERVLVGWLGAHPSIEALETVTAGLLQAAAGSSADAIAALEGVLAAPEPRISVPWLGSLGTALASCHLASGDLDAARRVIAEVRSGPLARWPGVRRDRAEQLARRLEAHGAPSPGVLTRRERDIAAGLMEGLTNGQLAERLYISPKTAAVHVSNILAKLGLSNRAEIAAWAVRNGIEPALTEAVPGGSGS